MAGHQKDLARECFGYFLGHIVNGSLYIRKHQACRYVISGKKMSRGHGLPVRLLRCLGSHFSFSSPVVGTCPFLKGIFIFSKENKPNAQIRVHWCLGGVAAHATSTRIPGYIPRQVFGMSISGPSYTLPTAGYSWWRCMTLALDAS